MKEQFLDYLKAIGLTETLVERVVGIYGFYTRLCPEDITGLFVCDYRTNDGGREYESLWFFSRSYSMEAKGFIHRDDFDMMATGLKLVHVQVVKEHYDFQRARPESRLNVRFHLSAEGFYGQLKASSENCDFLKAILREHVIPNLLASAGPNSLDTRD